MLRIIINADDFGINQIVTGEIESMVAIGAISSTTIMANGECLDDVGRFVPLHPEISFGAHLCLSEYSSLTKGDVLKQYGLVDEDGFFIRKAVFKHKNFNSVLLKSIKEELHAQIETIRGLGVRVSHADSHHHVHTIYALREIFAEVLKAQNIHKCRIGAEFDTWRMRRHVVSWYYRSKLTDYYKSHFVTTDKFLSYGEFYRSESDKPRDGVVELMCHPGHPGPSYKKEAKWVENKQLLNCGNIQLISYNDL